jgi:uncharacterized glyoxalase superfamily metalloenzyme YdcJ
MSLRWRTPSQLRAAFASSLSRLYASEVPLYSTLVRTTEQVNAEVLAADLAGDSTQLSRVSAERHGAIRLGTADELRQAAAVFAAFGMQPVGCYDLRGGADGGVPVVSTAFRPIRPDELAHNPFRMFTSLLAVDDRRYFTEELASRLTAFLSRRQVFSPRLLELAARAEAAGGLEPDPADELIRLATEAFRLSREPIDHDWYVELEAISSVAADIGGVPSTHINHLTPRVLDIDLLYQRMLEQGGRMTDAIQGPPRGAGPDVLLRQTSFRALAEPRRFRGHDGAVFDGELRVRFGEVEARGVALTDQGLKHYESALAAADADAADEGLATHDALARVWGDHFPATEAELFERGLAAYTLSPVVGRAGDGRTPTSDVAQLVRDGFAQREPIVYEDFLPRSAAGIFQSNLTRPSDVKSTPHTWSPDRSWMAETLQREVHEPTRLYAAQQHDSVVATLAALEVQPAPSAPTRAIHEGALR